MSIFGDEVIISPGFTNAHSHVALNSVKGLGYGTASALYDVMWGVEPALDESSVYKLSLLGMVDAIRSGTTSINDHYFFANSVAKAASKIGIRGFIILGLIHLITIYFIKTEIIKKLKNL